MAVDVAGVRSEVRPVYGGDPTPLRRGGMLKCPECDEVHPEWRFEERPRDPRYRSQTWPVLKCPACKRHFSLRECGCGG